MGAGGGHELSSRCLCAYQQANPEVAVASAAANTYDGDGDDDG